MAESSEYGGAGAGGKLTRRSYRSRAPSTPYDRPPLAEKKKAGWLSKLLVKPASRLLPSIFGSPSVPSSPERQDQDPEQVQDRPPVETEKEQPHVSTLASNNQNCELRTSDAFAERRQQKVDPRCSGPVTQTSSDHGIADIEQQLLQKNLSIEETKHLIEVLRSRTTGLSDDSGHTAGSKLETEVTLDEENSRKSTKVDYKVQFDLGTQQNSSDHFSLPADDTSSSPIEIAKAYMETLTSASRYGAQTGGLKNEKSLSCYGDAVTKLSFTPVAKSPMCWPGAIMPSDHGYDTPRRGSVVRHPRTPYSRSILSKSTSKLQASLDRPDRLSATRSCTHAYGVNMTAASTNSTPFSPVHNIRQKNISHISEGAGLSTPATSFSKLDASRVFSSGIDCSRGVVSEIQPADEAIEASRYSTGFAPVHPQSSIMAKKILERLDRTVPSPKEKLEINLAKQKASLKIGTPFDASSQHKQSDLAIADKQKISAVIQEAVDAQKIPSAKSSSMFGDKDQLSLPQSSKAGAFQSATASSEPFRMPENRSNSSREAMLPTVKPHKNLKIQDNGFSFTFPGSANPLPLSDPPPTPTMASPPATTGNTVSTSEATIPSFSFGSGKSSDRIVFSFGSTVSPSASDAATPNFKFGSEGKKPRLSFKTIGKDAISISSH